MILETFTLEEIEKEIKKDFELVHESTKNWFNSNTSKIFRHIKENYSEKTVFPKLYKIREFKSRKYNNKWKIYSHIPMFYKKREDIGLGQIFIMEYPTNKGTHYVVANFRGEDNVDRKDAVTRLCIEIYTPHCISRIKSRVSELANFKSVSDMLYHFCIVTQSVWVSQHKDKFRGVINDNEILVENKLGIMFGINHNHVILNQTFITHDMCKKDQEKFINELKANREKYNETYLN